MTYSSKEIADQLANRWMRNFIGTEECVLSGLIEQALTEAYSQGQKDEREINAALIEKLACNACRSKKPDRDGEVSNHSTCMRIIKLAKAIRGRI